MLSSEDSHLNCNLDFKKSTIAVNGMSTYLQDIAIQIHSQSKGIVDSRIWDRMNSHTSKDKLTGFGEIMHV